MVLIEGQGVEIAERCGGVCIDMSNTVLSSDLFVLIYFFFVKLVGQLQQDCVVAVNKEDM